MYPLYPVVPPNFDTLIYGEIYIHWRKAYIFLLYRRFKNKGYKGVHRVHQDKKGLFFVKKYKNFITFFQKGIDKRILMWYNKGTERGTPLIEKGKQENGKKLRQQI